MPAEEAGKTYEIYRASEDAPVEQNAFHSVCTCTVWPVHLGSGSSVSAEWQWFLRSLGNTRSRTNGLSSEYICLSRAP